MKYFLGKDLLCHSVTSWQFQEPRDGTLEWKSGRIFDTLRLFSFQCIHPKGPPSVSLSDCPGVCPASPRLPEHSSARAVAKEMPQHSPVGSPRASASMAAGTSVTGVEVMAKSRAPLFTFTICSSVAKEHFFSHLPCAVDKAPCSAAILPSFKKCFLLCTIHGNVVVTILSLQVYTHPPSRKVTTLDKNQDQNTFGALFEPICILGSTHF